jgi:hypothetical protein
MSPMLFVLIAIQEPEYCSLAVVVRSLPANGATTSSSNAATGGAALTSGPTIDDKYLALLPRSGPNR